MSNPGGTTESAPTHVSGSDQGRRTLVCALCRTNKEGGPRFPMSSRGPPILTLHSPLRAAGHEAGETSSDPLTLLLFMYELELKSRRSSHPSRHPRRRTARPHRPGTPHSKSAPRPLASRAHQQPRTYCHPAVQARSPLNARRLAPPSPLPRRRRSARQLRQLAEAILFSLLTGSVLQIGAAGRCCGRACHRAATRSSASIKS